MQDYETMPLHCHGGVAVAATEGSKAVHARTKNHKATSARI